MLKEEKNLNQSEITTDDDFKKISEEFEKEKEAEYEKKKGKIYLYWTRRPSRSYAKAGMNRPAGVKTAHSCGHTSS